MKLKCLACGIEKDTEVQEVYPFPEDGIIDAVPIEPFFFLEVQPWDDFQSAREKWRKTMVCHGCFHRLEPDMWISSKCWKALDPVTPFEELPLLLKSGE